MINEKNGEYESLNNETSYMSGPFLPSPSLALCMFSMYIRLHTWCMPGMYLKRVSTICAECTVSKEWTFGPELCDMWTVSDVLCCTASILHLVAIALDRLFKNLKSYSRTFYIIEESFTSLKSNSRIFPSFKLFKNCFLDLRLFKILKTNSSRLPDLNGLPEYEQRHNLTENS
ncbi:hypothetical protein Anas_07886 [Armadillidium nasatum]|uniref:Uncharacterized protein n=1 Tax=Armadillidium nasatum TaxID=96803 RepID=A0A5N5T8C7_9CRUS|nr:hypothetical protein Anas_07886 [Armadillidium nasatum]